MEFPITAQNTGDRMNEEQLWKLFNDKYTNTKYANQKIKRVCYTMFKEGYRLAIEEKDKKQISVETDKIKNED